MTHINSVKNTGFTLIELLVAISIMTFILGIIGPMTVNSLSKANAKSELLTFKNTLKQASWLAYTRGEPLVFNLQGKQAELKSAITNEQVTLINFQYLFFNTKQLYFSNFGFVNSQNLSIRYKAQELTIDLAKLVNNEVQPLFN